MATCRLYYYSQQSSIDQMRPGLFSDPASKLELTKHVDCITLFARFLLDKSERADKIARQFGAWQKTLSSSFTSLLT